jgi:hypothetical protein
MRKIVILILLFAGALKAETTWIPISNGNIVIIIPFIPGDIYQAPENLNIANGLITWTSVLHASSYLVQGLTTSGEWIDILVTKHTNESFDSRFAGYSQIRVTACNYQTCNETGNYAHLNTANSTGYQNKKYTYDALGRLICVSDSQYGFIKYELDGAGNRKSVTRNTCG